MARLELGRKASFAIATSLLLVVAGTTSVAADTAEVSDQQTTVAQQQPTEPGEPQDPVEPQEPAEPGEPGEPADPDQPDDPFVDEPQQQDEPDPFAPQEVLGEMEDVEDAFFVRVTPGVWAPWVFGDVATDEQQAEVERGIGDAFADFGLGWTGGLQIGFGEFSILTDAFYLTTLQEDAETDAAFDEADLDMNKFGLNTSVAWTAQLNDFGEVGPHAGVRYLWVDSELDTVDDEDVEDTFEATEGWIEPIVGVTGRIDPDPEGMLYFPFYADVGGIVAGSELSWQAKAAVGVELHEYLGVELGYRHLHVNYEGDDLDYDVMTSGPTLGVTGKFE